MDTLVIARVYAQALLEEIGTVELGEKVTVSLERIQSVFEEHRDLGLALFNPCYRPKHRLAILKEVMDRAKTDELASRFLGVLLFRRRLDTLKVIIKLFRRMIDEKFGRIWTKLEVASPMSPKQEKKLKTTLEKLLKAEVLLNTKEKPELLAGFKVTAGSIVFDASLSSLLDDLTKILASPCPVKEKQQ